jgi:transketolase
VTHQAIEDIAIMRATPNMTILETGDATEVETVLDVAHAIDGPVYVRMLRGEVPRLFSQDEPMRLNQARVLHHGTDVAIITAGITTEEAMRATSVLQNKGVSISHVHISTHKPFTDPAVFDAIVNARYGVITLENHTIIGGLGAGVAELMAEEGVGKKLVRLGLRDTYSHGASRHYLMKEYQLDAISLVRAVEKLIGQDTGITEDDLATVRLQAVHSAVKAEAL